MASRGLNKVMLIGNLGRDPDVSSLPSGMTVANVALATTETWKDKNTGERQEKTEWHRVTFYGKLADVVREYTRKGSRLYVEGSNRTSSWEEDGKKRYSTEVVAAELRLLDGGTVPSPQNSDNPRQQQPRPSAPRPAPPSVPNTNDLDDDIPF